jgi:type IV secretion system protein VirD4
MNKKFAFALAVGVAAFVSGIYLSGFLALLFLQLDAGQLTWLTYYEYQRALDLPEVRPYARTIRIAGYVGFGSPLLAYAALLVLILKPSRKPLHGNARFAGITDLARKGLFKAGPDGVIVGRYKGRYIRLSGQQFAILAAPTRSGKGVGVVVPNLLEYQESVVVLDIKQENFQLTSGWRASQGQEVFLFNPFAEDRRSHRWNPLSYVSADPAFRISDLQAIAAMLYPDGDDRQKFWTSHARNAFLAFSLFLFDRREADRAAGFQGACPTLGAVYRIPAATSVDLRAHLQAMAGEPFLGDATRVAFANLLSQAEETFASIIGTFREPLNAWVNPVLDAATSEDDFLLTDLRRKRMTIYVGIQPNKLAEARLILNLFFSQLINLNTRELPASHPELRQQCLLLMDEFTSIGRVDIIASAVAYMAGYNLRLLPIIQSMAQLDATYGKETARTIVTNHALQIVFAPREQRDANDYSEMLGYTTLRRQNVTRGRDFTKSESEERRALMLPQELKALGERKEVILYEGLPHPVLCDKVRYYEERHFTKRLLPPVRVEQIGV